MEGMVVNPLETVPFWVGLSQWPAHRTDTEVEEIHSVENRDSPLDSWIQRRGCWTWSKI